MESQNLEEPPGKNKKAYGRETEPHKEKEKFQLTEEIVEYLLDSP